MSKPPCSASRKAQWNPAAARMRATSGERSWAKPQPSCVLPRERACLTGFIRMYGRGSDYQDTVVGTIQVYILVQASDQIQTVLGEEGEDGIVTLLDVLGGIDQASKRVGLGLDALGASQELAGC